MKLNELATQPVDTKAEAAWDAWDAQIEADLKAGKLDGAIEAAKQEHEAGETTPL